MAHIHTEPGNYDHTVTAYIVRFDSGEPRILLHMHRTLGMLLPPGGHIELDETPWSAMAHELLEETGYVLAELSVMQPATRIHSLNGVVLHPQPIVMQTHDITSEHFHSDTSYLLIAERDPMQQPVEGESTDVRWLSRQEIVGLPSGIVWDNTRTIALAIFDTFLGEWERIPAVSFSTQSPEV